MRKSSPFGSIMGEHVSCIPGLKSKAHGPRNAYISPYSLGFVLENTNLTSGPSIDIVGFDEDTGGYISPNTISGITITKLIFNQLSGFCMLELENNEKIPEVDEFIIEIPEYGASNTFVWDAVNLIYTTIDQPFSIQMAVNIGNDVEFDVRTV